MLLVLRGLTAIGVSSWAATSRLTSVTNTAGPRRPVAKLGRGGAVGAGGSAHAARPRTRGAIVPYQNTLRLAWVLGGRAGTNMRAGRRTRAPPGPVTAFCLPRRLALPGLCP